MIQARFYPIPQVGGPGPADQQTGRSQKPRQGSGEFGEILRTEVGRSQDLRFSAHARKRLEDRNIRITPEESARLQSAVDRVEQKGARDSLVMFNDYALIVSVRNRTVVTALDHAQMREKVITNIDSTVLA